jgi:hypothetical protein
MSKGTDRKGEMHSISHRDTDYYKTDRHDITEILLTVALNTITPFK